MRTLLKRLQDQRSSESYVSEWAPERLARAFALSKALNATYKGDYQSYREQENNPISLALSSELGDAGARREIATISDPLYANAQLSPLAGTRSEIRAAALRDALEHYTRTPQALQSVAESGELLSRNDLNERGIPFQPEPAYDMPEDRMDNVWATRAGLAPALNDYTDAAGRIVFSKRRAPVLLEDNPRGNILKSPVDLKKAKAVFLPKDQLEYPDMDYIPDEAPLLSTATAEDIAKPISEGGFPVAKQAEFDTLREAIGASDFGHRVRSALGNAGLLAGAGLLLGSGVAQAAADEDRVASGDTGYRPPSGGTAGAASAFIGGPESLALAAPFLGAGVAGQEMGSSWPEPQPAELGNAQYLSPSAPSQREAAMNASGPAIAPRRKSILDSFDTSKW